MNGLTRFFTEGLRDLERRVSSLVAPLPVDELRVVDMFESSAVFSTIVRLVEGGAKFAESSVLLMNGRRFVSRWAGRSWAWQRFSTGFVLIVAVAVHVALTLSHQSPVGWLWLVLPGVGAALGLLLIVMSGFGRAVFRLNE